MCNDRLFAQESPQELMLKNGCDSLEDVFLKISNEDTENTPMEQVNLVNILICVVRNFDI
jgi:hypothetical protein